jgi:excisionase family DNA binding protein
MQNQVEAIQGRRVVTLGEAAKILRISRGSAYEAAKRREIPTIRIGRRLLVPAAALERMLDGHNSAEAKVTSVRNP